MSNGHGSDVQETPEWWMASDGRWYPPELHPDYVAPAAPEESAPVRPEPSSPIETVATIDPGDSRSLSLAERLRAAADRVGEEASSAADEIGEEADEHADRVVGGATISLSGATRATLGGAAATGIADGVSQPGESEAPEVPAMPGVAEAAEAPEAPEVPAMPGAVEAPEVPEVPAMPGAVEAPGVPVVPAMPDAVEAPEVPVVPVVPVVPPAAVEVPPVVPPTEPPEMPQVPPAVPPATEMPPGVPSAPTPPPPSSAPTSVGAVPPAPSAPAPTPPPPSASAPTPPPPTGPPPAAPSGPGSPPPPTGPPAIAAPSAASGPGQVVEGPGGIQYIAPPEQDLAGSFAASPPGPPPQPPGPAGAPPIGAPPGPGAAPGWPGPAPAQAATGAEKRTSPLAGAIAGLGGLAALAGSFLQWGTGSVESSSGVERAVIEVAGFDSNGVLTAIGGVALLAVAALFFTGALRQLHCAIAAFVAGGVIVGAVVFSMIDIADLSDRYAVEWEATGLAQVGDIVTTQADIGLWIAGIGGVLGVLSAPFADRR